MNKERKAIIEANEISELFTFDLAGISQKVLIEGKQKKLPIVITLHGGPGTPIPFCVGCRGLFPEFTDKFIMVYWDQYGCGANNNKSAGNAAINDYVNMTIDLVHEVKRKFPGNKIYFFATSWGTVLSTLSLTKEPELVDGVLAWGQIIKNVLFNDDVMNALRNSKLSIKKMSEIENMTRDNMDKKKLIDFTKAVRKYTKGYSNNDGKNAPILPFIMGYLSSSDYSFKDFLAIVNNESVSNMTIWKELLKIDITDELSNVNVPYTILQGDTDIVTSTKSVKELVEAAENKNLSVKVVVNSGHIPGAEAMEASMKELEKLTARK